jgi:hypothetical protein
MNWSAFFAGAPEGFQKGMKFTQDYNQSQRTNPLEVQKQQLANQQSQAMNPLLQAQQGLQNQGMLQRISQGGQNFAREGNAYDAFTRAYGQPGQGQGGGAMPNMDNIPAGPQAYGHGQIPQGMPPTTQPYGGMANMPHTGGIPQGQDNIFSQMGRPNMQGPQFQNNQQPQNYGGAGGPMSYPWMGWGQNRGGVQ